MLEFGNMELIAGLATDIDNQKREPWKTVV